MGAEVTELHNHWCCKGVGCSGRPLTLADREVITGRSIRWFDAATGKYFCGDCLADLPDGLEGLSHVCGESGPAVGDLVRYHGRLGEYHGTLWEVTRAGERGLILFDVDRALWNVSASSVTVVGR